MLVSGEIKLTDFDDVDNEEPECLTNSDCFVKGSKGNKTLPCYQGRCKGVLDAKNVENVGRYFINHILIPGGPENLIVHLNEIKSNLQRLKWDSGILALHMERVHSLLRSGKHKGILWDIQCYILIQYIKSLRKKPLGIRRRTVHCFDNRTARLRKIV